MGALASGISKSRKYNPGGPGRKKDPFVCLLNIKECFKTPHFRTQESLRNNYEVNGRIAALSNESLVWLATAVPCQMWRSSRIGPDYCYPSKVNLLITSVRGRVFIPELFPLVSSVRIYRSFITIFHALITEYSGVLDTLPLTTKHIGQM